MYYIRHLVDRVAGRLPMGVRRSRKWREVRREHLDKNPICVVCHSKKKRVVHHLVPVSVAPELELEKDNLITLCTSKKYGINCHLLVGHLGNYKSANPDCASDSWDWYRKIMRGKDIEIRFRKLRETPIKN